MLTWNELPEEIQNKMLEYQEKEWGYRHPKNFIENIYSMYGFDWEKSKEGREFWRSIITGHQTDVFYKVYPKKTYLSEKINNLINKLESYEF